MPISKAQQKATAKYKAKMYDRIELIVPKGQKSTIQAVATAQGESINSLVGKAILAYLGLTEWPEGEESPP